MFSAFGVERLFNAVIRAYGSGAIQKSYIEQNVHFGANKRQLNDEYRTRNIESYISRVKNYNFLINFFSEFLKFQKKIYL